MTEAALDELLESLGGGQPISDLYKKVTTAKNKNECDFEYLKYLTTADLNTVEVKYLSLNS